jgi:hypothetical protein
MKFKLDENLGSSSAEHLQIAGFDVVTVHMKTLVVQPIITSSPSASKKIAAS